MKKLLFFSLFTILLLKANSSSSELSSFNGNTGLLETPNARLMPDWCARLFLNQSKPYTYYGITLTPLPFMEVNLHVTRINGINGFNDQNSSYGDYKDKSINIKFLLHKESELLPAIVIGADDIWGTALYSSKYIVLSKKYKNFDISLGYAKGRLGGEDLRGYNSSSNSGGDDNSALKFLKRSGLSGGKLFGGIQFTHNKLVILAEYSSIDYEKDRVNPFLKGAKYQLPNSKCNFGLRYLYSKNTTFSLAYLRGNELSFGFNYQFGFNREGMFKHIIDRRYKASKNLKEQSKNIDDTTLANYLSKEIAKEKYANVKTSVNKRKVWTEIDNTRYNEDLKAIGRVIGIISDIVPDRFEHYYVTIKHHDIPYKTMKLTKNSSSLTRDTQKYFNEFSQKNKIYITKNTGTKKFHFYVKPIVNTFLNDKEKPFTIKISAMAGFMYDFKSGLFISGAISHPLYNTIKDIKSAHNEDEDTKLALNSSMIDYIKYNDTQLAKLVVDYIFRAPKNSFGKVEVGYLSYSFAGLDLEWFKPLLDDKFGIGLEYQKVYKRRVDKIFKVFSDYKYDAKFLNLYYYLSPKYDLHLNLKAGEFLAGDKGVRVNIERNYKSFTVGAYATVTDSNHIFKSSFNRGYIDKGIYIKVPLDVFTYENVKGRATYQVTPWTRDVGQFAPTTYNLSNMLNNENNLRVMMKNIKLISY